MIAVSTQNCASPLAIQQRCAAIATVSLNPAEAAGLIDRGALLPGRRADIVRVRPDGDVPVVRGVWREGTRVA